MICDLLGNYGFHFSADIPAPAAVSFTVGAEKRSSADYFYDNRSRAPEYLFQYTLSGTGTVVLNGERHTVSRGDAFFLHFPGDSAYCFDESVNEGPWHFIWLLFPEGPLDGYYTSAVQKAGNILTLPETCRSVTALTELHRAAREDRIRTPFDAQGLLVHFLCMLCSDCLYPDTEYSRPVQEAMRIMEEEYASVDGVASLSRRLGVTHSHLTRLFTAETGTSPLSWLTRIRLQKAVNLLSSTREPIDAVARLCGFSCGNYFSKTFRRHMGVSPLTYRNSTANIAYSNFRI